MSEYVVREEFAKVLNERIEILNEFLAVLSRRLKKLEKDRDLTSQEAALICSERLRICGELGKAIESLKQEKAGTKHGSEYFCNSTSYEFEVVKNPKIRSGIPTIKGTRFGVYEVAALAETDGVESTLESFETLNRDMIEKSIQYAKDHPKGREL